MILKLNELRVGKRWFHKKMMSQEKLLSTTVLSKGRRKQREEGKEIEGERGDFCKTSISRSINSTMDLQSLSLWIEFF